MSDFPGRITVSENKGKKDKKENKNKQQIIILPKLVHLQSLGLSPPDPLDQNVY